MIAALADDFCNFVQDDESGPSCLTDGLLDTYWESDGSQGNHWIRLKMKKGTVVL